MKILALNASYRSNRGYTYFLTEKLFEGARSEGAETEILNLADCEIKRCQSCHVCQTDKSLLKCVYQEKDDVSMIFQKMREADIIVYATPVYFYSTAGLLKILMERMYSLGKVTNYILSKSGLLFHDSDHVISQKPSLVLTCCNNIENESVRNIKTFFKTFAKFHDTKLLGFLIRNGGRMVGHGKDKEAEKEYPKIQRVYKAYVQAGKELARNMKIRRSTLRKANQEIIPVPMFKYLKTMRPIKGIMLKEALKGEENS